MSDWLPMTRSEVCIVTRAARGGSISINGEDFAFLVCGKDDESPIAVRSVEDLREMVPALRPASIEVECIESEREVMQALLDAIRKDRRYVEALH